MQMVIRAIEVSNAQAKAASEASQAVSACIGAMLEASAAFAKSSAARNAALGATMLAANSPAAASQIHAAFMRDSMRAASLLAARVADVCNATAKQCGALAAQTMEAAMALGAPAGNSN